MSILIKISLPGVDVKTAKPEQCVIHSNYANPKIEKRLSPPHRGLIQLVMNGSYPAGETILYSFPHGYKYTPMVWATIADNTTNSQIFGFQPYISGVQSVDVRCDSQNFYIVAVVSAFATPWKPLITLNISYAIFADNGANN